MDKNSVKKNIRKAREESHYTQERLAEELGISRTAYRNLENGKTNPFNVHITAMAEVMGIAPEELVLGYTPHEISPNTLNEISKYKDRIKALEQTLKEREDHIASLKDTIASKDETIKSKNDIIEMLNREK